MLEAVPFLCFFQKPLDFPPGGSCIKEAESEDAAMKIQQVEELVGISKKNIRFYEEQGLLSPGRAENGYREYGREDVRRLQQIKLLRKLAVPIEDIREGKLDALPDKNQTLLLYCWTGRRSEDSAELLSSYGYKNVYEFGGLVDWTGKTESGNTSGDS